MDVITGEKDEDFDDMYLVTPVDTLHQDLP